MSGRARHWRDGKLIANRKTDRRQSEPKDKINPADLPEYVLRFELPPLLGFAISEGPTGVIGVSVTMPGPYVEIRGKNLEWVLRQAAAYIGSIAKGREQVLPARITRDAYPGPTMGGPLRPPLRYSCELIYVPGAAVVVPRDRAKPMIFAVDR